MRYVSIEKCKQGDIVALDLHDNNFRLLITRGKVLSSSYIRKIKTLGISGIYIEDAETKGIDATSILPDELKCDILLSLQEMDFEKIHRNAERLVECITSSDTMVNEFINMKSFDNYTYEHSLSVAVYSVMLGASLGFNMEELVNLALSGLLHDIGKLYVNANILNKNGKLTDREYAEIKKHAVLGYEQVKNYTTISATIKSSIYQHHENENGTGYPLGITGDKIYKFAKIIHITDVYDAIISKRPYKEEKTSAYALRFLIENSGKMFSKEYVNEFVRIIPAYPKCSNVELSDGRTALVYQNTYDNTFRPIIRFENGEIIDLSENRYEYLWIINE